MDAQTVGGGYDRWLMFHTYLVTIIEKVGKMAEKTLQRGDKSGSFV
jgi:hypothetical protein